MFSLVDFLNEFIICSPLVMHISAPILEFPALILHRNATHKVVTIYMTQLMTNLDGAVSCLQKTNHTADLAASGNGRVHVCAQLSRVNCALAFHEVILHQLLQKLHHTAVAISSFLAASWRLILELSIQMNSVCEIMLNDLR